MLRLGAQKWEVHRGSECHACKPVFGLRDRFWARQWLQQFKGDALAIRAIRDLLSNQSTSGTLSRMSDDDAIAQMANLLSCGTWHVHTQAVEAARAGGAGAGKPAEAIPEEMVHAPEVRRLPARGRSSERSMPVEETASLPRTADEAAIATSLRRAADHGIPFCEECMKASLRNVQPGGVHG